jgi:hypothetical protein
MQVVHHWPEQTDADTDTDLHAHVDACRTKVSLNVMAETATCQLIEGASLAGYNLTEVCFHSASSNGNSLLEAPAF